MRGKWLNQGAPLLMVCTRYIGRFSVPPCLLFHGSVGQMLSKPERTGLQRQQPHCQHRKHQDLERLTNAVLWWVQEEEHSIPLTYRANFRLRYWSHPWWVVESDRIAVAGPVRKRKVPGSNHGRSLGHFYHSVIPHASRSLTFKHLMPLIWKQLPLNTDDAVIISNTQKRMHTNTNTHTHATHTHTHTLHDHKCCVCIMTEANLSPVCSKIVSL